MTSRASDGSTSAKARVELDPEAHLAPFQLPVTISQRPGSENLELVVSIPEARGAPIALFAFALTIPGRAGDGKSTGPSETLTTRCPPGGSIVTTAELTLRTSPARVAAGESRTACR